MFVERRRNNMIAVWWGEKFVYDEEQDLDIEVDPDILFAEHEAQKIAIEVLRGPIGPVGPMGTPCDSGRH